MQSKLSLHGVSLHSFSTLIVSYLVPHSFASLWLNSYYALTCFGDTVTPTVTLGVAVTVIHTAFQTVAATVVRPTVMEEEATVEEEQALEEQVAIRCQI